MRRTWNLPVRKAYFQKGLLAYPDLRFEPVRTLTGVDSMLLYYHSVNGLLAAEMMIINDAGQIENVRRGKPRTGPAGLDAKRGADLPDDNMRRERRIDHEGTRRLFQDGELAGEEFLRHEMIDAMGQPLAK